MQVTSRLIRAYPRQGGASCGNRVPGSPCLRAVACGALGGHRASRTLRGLVGLAARAVGLRSRAFTGIGCGKGACASLRHGLERCSSPAPAVPHEGPGASHALRAAPPHRGGRSRRPRGGGATRRASRSEWLLGGCRLEHRDDAGAYAPGGQGCPPAPLLGTRSGSRHDRRRVPPPRKPPCIEGRGHQTSAADVLVSKPTRSAEPFRPQAGCSQYAAPRRNYLRWPDSATGTSWAKSTETSNASDPTEVTCGAPAAAGVAAQPAWER